MRSFKIEGRYKDMTYVKNITADYRQQLDEILLERPELARSSSGFTEHFFCRLIQIKPSTVAARITLSLIVKLISVLLIRRNLSVCRLGANLGIGKNDISVQTTEALANGDGLNVLYKREVVGFRAKHLCEQVCEYEQDGQVIRQYRVVPNDMRAELKELRPPPYPTQSQYGSQLAASTAKEIRRASCFSGLAAAIG